MASSTDDAAVLIAPSADAAAPVASGADAAALISPHQICSSNALPPEYRVLKTLGIVRGVTVRSRNIGANIGASFKAMVGGEIQQLTKLCEDTRKEAFERMLEQALERGANGVIAVRYDQNMLVPGISEVIAYGMAVSDGSNAAHCEENEGGMQASYVCTSNELPGHTVHHSLGVVHGITVRCRNVFANLGAGLRSIGGGEIKTWTALCEGVRKEAYSRMVAEAVARGADGIVAVRYNTSDVQPGICEVLAFGTAVASGGAPGAPPPPMGGEAMALPLHMVTTSSTLTALSSHYSLGVVHGITVRTKNVIANIGAGLKSTFGGESCTWLGLCRDTRAQAMARMLERARVLGAKGVVSMRYDCNQVTPNIIEVIAYGTAVTDEPPTDLPTDGLPKHRISTDLFGIAGYAAKSSLGTVRGISVQCCNLFRSFGAGLKAVVGGEVRNFSRMCEIGRDEAFARMVQHGVELGATGIAGMRFESTMVEPGVIEVVAYGTAVTDATGIFAAVAAGDAVPQAMVTTTNALPGHIMPRSLGLVQGITVRSRNFIRNIGAGFKKMFGGEIRTFTELCETARVEALERLLKQAGEMGASGVVALRYETEDIAPGMTEVLAYGTAVA